MIDVTVRNFQSIEKASFRIDGFTVVVGRSNIGKSALVRAVKAALTGAPATSFVRHGAACLRRTKGAKTCKCYASVHMVTDGFDLLWEKGDAINRYTFNGQVYDKAERGTPEFLVPQFSPVKVGDRQDVLQVADQFSPIFLLDQTGGAVADTLSDVARLDRINSAMRLAEKDRKEAVSTRKVRERDVVDLRAKLVHYAGLDTVLQDVRDLERAAEDAVTQERHVQRLDAYLEAVSASSQTIRTYENALRVEVPDIKPIRESSEKLDAIISFVLKLSLRAAEVQGLTGIEGLNVPTSDRLSDATLLLDALQGWFSRLVSLRDWLLPYKELEALAVPTPESLVRASQDVLCLMSFDTSLAHLVSTIRTLEADLQDVEAEARVLSEEREALGFCPTCRGPLSLCGGVS